jgi:hypothetical protein
MNPGWGIAVESDDEDLPASYLFYVVAVMVAIAVAVISTFFFLIR